MLRETTFWLGGALTIGLGLALAAGLVWAGASLDYFAGYMGVAFGVALGSFFIYVGGAEARERRAFLAEADRSSQAPSAERNRPR
ncbi:MAG TPA: hypothetical protein VN842_01120 [Thermoplasmata archaeon]|nr:hypothetical protein [Thermoplasmata archaeon]